MKFAPVVVAPPAGHLVANLVNFARLLRAVGMDAHPSGVMDLARGLDLMGIKSRSEVYYTARALLVTRREQLPLFDRAFELFWRAPAERHEIPIGGTRALIPRRKSPAASGPSNVRLEALSLEPPRTTGAYGQDPQAMHASRTYSPAELLRRKDFGLLSAKELEEVKRLMAELDLDLGFRRSRRWLQAGRYPTDLHYSIRRSLYAGGELLELFGRQPKWKPPALVVIADISGSMERYSGLLLRFICGMARSQARPIESFVFSTQLTHITRHLRSRDVERSVAEITRNVPDWSGGTRIGQALRTFNLQWARRLLGRRAVVLLISDGWDRGDIELLSREMARLQRSCHRLIWLNPLLGSPHFEPLTMGLEAALPFVDDFLPIHNLESLEQLAAELDRLSPKRPSRRQPRPSVGSRSITRLVAGGSGLGPRAQLGPPPPPT